MLESCFTRARPHNRSITITTDLWRIEGNYDLAELHLLAAGKRDSARLLGEMMAKWAGAGGTPGAFALRGTLPYVPTRLFAIFELTNAPDISWTVIFWELVLSSPPF
jgi:hypothetical protein